MSTILNTSFSSVLVTFFTNSCFLRRSSLSFERSTFFSTVGQKIDRKRRSKWFRFQSDQCLHSSPPGTPPGSPRQPPPVPPQLPPATPPGLVLNFRTIMTKLLFLFGQFITLGRPFSKDSCTGNLRRGGILTIPARPIARRLRLLRDDQVLDVVLEALRRESLSLSSHPITVPVGYRNLSKPEKRATNCVFLYLLADFIFHDY